MLLFKYLFITKYISAQIRKVLAYILDKQFDKIPAFENQKDKIIFLSGNYGILTANIALLEHIKTPYALIYNENLNDVYTQQYHANFLSYGFTKKIFYTPVIEVNNDLLPLKTTIKDFYIYIKHNRVQYTANISIIASSYDELLDITTSLSSLIVPNRYFLYNIPVEVFIPNKLKLYNATSNYIINLAENSQILQLKNFSLIDKESLIYTDTIPVYMKLDNFTNQPIPLFETSEHIYKSEATIFIDMPIVKLIELQGAIPILGIDLKINIENNIGNYIVQSSIYKINEHINEIKINNDNINEIIETITINENEQLIENSFNVILQRNNLQEYINNQNNNIVMDLAALYIPFQLLKINNSTYNLKINYNFKQGDIVKYKYYTKKIDN